MDTNKQKVVIAEACPKGFIVHEDWQGQHVYFKHDNEVMILWEDTNALNAVHVAELELISNNPTEKEWFAYEALLIECDKRYNPGTYERVRKATITATASQRIEALIKLLNLRKV
jgi:hypothetical protein